jgi:succinoglycan biosynthesis transport protein ExoP
MLKNTAFDEPTDGRFTPSTPSTSMIHIVSEVFRRRFPVLMIITLACFLLSGVALFLITPKYIATARVKIDPNQSGVIAVDTQRTPDQSLVDTEASVLHSRATAISVVKALDLGADPEFATPKGATARPLSRDEQEEAIAQRLLANLIVQREKATYVVGVSYRGDDPRKAARIANAVILAYMSNSVGTRSGTASSQAEFLNKRLKEAGDDLAKTEAVAGQYKAEAGIIGSAGNGGYNATVADQQAASLSSQLATAEATASAAQSNLDVARKQMQQGGLDAVSAVLQSAVVTDLRRQRAEVVRTMGEIQARYGPRHPETIKVVQQLRQLDDQIDQEARRVMGSLASDAASKAAAAGTLRSQMSGLRTQQAATNKTVALAQSVEQQANAKREAYNRLAAEAQQVTQLSRNMQTQAQMLEPAIPPPYPAYPNKGMILAFGLLLGLSLGLAVITLQELLMKGLRTGDDVEGRLNLPFIGSIPRVSARAFKSAGKHANPADLLVDTPIIPFAESLRAARSVLTLGANSAKVVALVSALPDEGKTTSVL